MRSGLCISNMVYLDQFVCLSDGVILKVVATSIAEIDRPVYHDVRNSMPHPTYGYNIFDIELKSSIFPPIEISLFTFIIIKIIT